MRAIFLLALLAVTTFGQVAYNQREYNVSISNFSSDTILYSNKFPVGDYEGVAAIVLTAEDDSSKFVFGYQRGYNYNGRIVWDRPAVIIDTFDITTAGNIKTFDSLTYNAHLDTNVTQALDTTQYAGYNMMIAPFTPYRSPFARFFVKGLTGNSTAAYTVYITASLTKYQRVDVGTTKQPEQYE